MSVDPFCLVDGAGIAVQDVSAAGVRFGQTIGYELVHQVVWDQKALLHQVFGHRCLGRLRLDGIALDGTQDVSGRDLRDAVPGHEELGLRAFADARGSQKEDRPGQKVGSAWAVG